MSAHADEVRIERDSLGEVEVPAGAYWGAQTQRAVENFPISGLEPDPSLVRAYAFLKRAAATVNARLGVLDGKLAGAIVQAADEVLAGKLAGQFVVDPFQAGAGTSHHMNVNEVLANRANEILGGARGEYKPVHPNNHVNFGQSTNDTFPTALRLAVLLRAGGLEEALDRLAGAFREKGRAFARTVTTGRTHLQDATPITVGQIMDGYAGCLERAREGLAEAAEPLQELGLGGTAVGTGINRHPDYPREVCAELARLTGLEVAPAADPVAMHPSMLDFARYAGALKTTALELTRVANDLRLMSSGPTSGIGEINLPAVQPGSSIMPGKVNPVMAENLNMVCFHVIGAETAVAFAAQAGQFQLNVMMPVIAYEILFSMEILGRALGVFRDRCVTGITVNEDACRAYAEKTISLATVLNPVLGYGKAAEVVKRALAEGRSVIAVAAEALGVSEEEAHRILDPERWTRPGIVDEKTVHGDGGA